MDELMIALNQFGLPGVVVWWLIKEAKENKGKLFETISAYIRLKTLKKSNALNVSIAEVKTHPYFDKINAHLASIKFTHVEAGGSTLDFKMYVADVTSYVNHWLYRKHLEKYLTKGDYANISSDFPQMLSSFALDCESAIEASLGPEIASIYIKATETVRMLYFDFMQTIISSRQIAANEKAYLILDLLEYRIGSSHTVLYKMFLEMNGKIEAQAGITPIMPKADVERILEGLNKINPKGIK
jgi:hypothetical protein